MSVDRRAPSNGRHRSRESSNDSLLGPRAVGDRTTSDNPEIKNNLIEKIKKIR